MGYNYSTIEGREKAKAARLKWYYNNKEKAVKRVLERRKEKRLWFSSLKSSLKCTKCSESEPSCLEFHHLDPAGKDWNLSEMARQGYSDAAVLEEMKKCVVLCANCHRKVHTKKLKVFKKDLYCA